jgi:hypothetical protein
MTRPFSINEVRLGGTIAVDPVTRTRDGQTVTELRLDVRDIEHGRELLPLTVALWPGEVEMIGLPPKVGRVAIVTGTLERSLAHMHSARRTVAEVRAAKVNVMPGEMD